MWKFCNYRSHGNFIFSLLVHHHNYVVFSVLYPLLTMHRGPARSSPQLFRRILGQASNIPGAGWTLQWFPLFIGQPNAGNWGNHSRPCIASNHKLARSNQQQYYHVKYERHFISNNQFKNGASLSRPQLASRHCPGDAEQIARGGTVWNPTAVPCWDQCVKKLLQRHARSQVTCS